MKFASFAGFAAKQVRKRRTSHLDAHQADLFDHWLFQSLCPKADPDQGFDRRNFRANSMALLVFVSELFARLSIDKVQSTACRADDPPKFVF